MSKNSEILLTDSAVDFLKDEVGGGGANNGHTLTVQFSTVYDRGSDVPPAQYQVFEVCLLKYLNGNVVTSIETITDNNEHTFENVIAYDYTYAGDTDLGKPGIEEISTTGITAELNYAVDNDNGNLFDWMLQLFTNSSIVTEYTVTLPEVALGQDLKDYVESLTNPAIYLSPEFEGFLQDNGVDINKVFVLGDVSEGLNGAFSIEATPYQNVDCKIMGGDTSIGYGEGASQSGGVETLKDLLSVDGGIWTCFTNCIQWKDLDKTINLSITIGGTNYEIKDISLDEIKTFIKEKQVVEEGEGGNVNK